MSTAKYPEFFVSLYYVEADIVVCIGMAYMMQKLTSQAVVNT